MSADASYGPYYAEGQVRVVALPTDIMVTMSDDVLTVIRQALERLIGLLERRDAPKTGRWGLRRSVDRVLAQMFPDAYADSAAAARFRQRHAAAMHAEVVAAAQRMLSWDGAAPAHLSRQDVDDWLMVLGSAQFLFVSRTRGLLRSVTTPEQRWLAYLMAQLVAAACPRLDAEVSGVFRTGL